MQSLLACHMPRRLMPPALAGTGVSACMHAPIPSASSSLRTSKLLPLGAAGASRAASCLHLPRACGLSLPAGAPCNPPSQRHTLPPCRSYFDWAIQAAKLDALEGVDQAQRWAAETRLYDRRLLR